MTAPLVDFTDQHAFVTGGGTGLGRAICLRLSSLGARVTAFDVDPSAAAGTVKLIEDSGGAAVALIGDVADRDAVAAAFARATAAFGPVDVLVNNAGINPHVPSRDLTPDDWSRISGVNLAGYLWCAQQLAAELIPAGRAGAIVNVSSIGGSTSLGRGNIAYGMTKGGVDQLTRELAIAWAPHGIRVNAVAPQLIATAANQALFPAELLAHAVQPGAIANVIAFLAGDLAAPVSGAIVPAYGI